MKKGGAVEFAKRKRGLGLNYGHLIQPDHLSQIFLKKPLLQPSFIDSLT
jgi:hypothetical protein